jgi:hypothetical protein
MMQIEFNEYGEVFAYSLQYKYPKLYQRIVDLTAKRNIEPRLTVIGCFYWHVTSEGHNFWKYVCTGAFGKASQMHPELFEMKKE